MTYLPHLAIFSTAAVGGVCGLYIMIGAFHMIDKVRPEKKWQAVSWVVVGATQSILAAAIVALVAVAFVGGIG